MLPYSYAPDTQDTLYVLDEATGQVYCFDQTGEIRNKISKLFDNLLDVAQSCHIAVMKNRLYVVTRYYPLVEIYDLQGNRINSFNYFNDLPLKWQDHYASILNKSKEFLRSMKPSSVTTSSSQTISGRRYMLAGCYYCRDDKLMIYASGPLLIALQPETGATLQFFTLPVESVLHRKGFATVNQASSPSDDLLLGNIRREQPACISKVPINNN